MRETEHLAQLLQRVAQQCQWQLEAAQDHLRQALTQEQVCREAHDACQVRLDELTRHARGLRQQQGGLDAHRLMQHNDYLGLCLTQAQAAQTALQSALQHSGACRSEVSRLWSRQQALQARTDRIQRQLRQAQEQAQWRLMDEVVAARATIADHSPRSAGPDGAVAPSPTLHDMDVVLKQAASNGVMA